MMEESEAREFAAAFRSFLEWVHDDAHNERRNEVAALVVDFLGEERSRRSVVARSLPGFEHVNFQTALDAWSAEPGREVEIHGFMVPPHHGETSLQQIVTGEVFGPLRLSPPSLADLPNGPASTLACLRRAIVLVTDTHGVYAVMVTGPVNMVRTSRWRSRGSTCPRPRRCTPAWTSCAAGSTCTADTFST
jgi:hypothetical protein